MTGTAIRKRSLSIAGHRTSVSLEDAFWDGLKEMAQVENLSVAELVARIDEARIGKARLREGQLTGLSSALRVAVLDYYRNRP